MKKILLVLAFGLIGVSYAQQSGQVSAAPVMGTEFKAGDSQLKFGLTSISMEGEGFEMSGGALNFMGRNGVSDMVGFNMGMNLLALSGSAGETDLTMSSLGFDFMLELQAPTEVITPILFLGPSLSFSSFSTDFPTTDAYGNEFHYMTHTSTTLSGMAVGAQLVVNLGNILKVTPYYMTRSLSGTAEMTSNVAPSASMTIDNITMTSYGFDVYLVPINMTLSSIMQKMEEEDKDAVDTTMLQLSWVF